MILGNDAARGAFLSAMRGPALHHAWLFAGPEGIGKGSFARAAAIRMLAEAASESLSEGLEVPSSSSTRMLIAAGSHPDYRELARQPKDGKEDGDLARSITIAQVRALQPMFATAPTMGPRRVVLIDAVDDLERGGANALLKNLEEPPAGTIFLLISQAPGRLLPTIRSRCRLLRFEPLDAATVESVVRGHLPDTNATEIVALVKAGNGSPGRALGYAGLDLAALDTAIAKIAEDGDVRNTTRSRLAKMLALKAAQPRYDAFLDRAPAFIAAEAARRSGARLRDALDAYDAARTLSGAARGLSLDQQGTVFEMAGLVARLAR
ncbi:hypothetical protein BH09PSE4_BH09PSE4_03590 [soil metagenome]